MLGRIAPASIAGHPAARARYCGGTGVGESPGTFMVGRQVWWEIRMPFPLQAGAGSEAREAGVGHAVEPERPGGLTRVEAVVVEVGAPVDAPDQAPDLPAVDRDPEVGGVKTFFGWLNRPRGSRGSRKPLRLRSSDGHAPVGGFRRRRGLREPRDPRGLLSQPKNVL